MRIVAGIYGGRRLDQPKGCDIRPTSDKVRGAVFNVLRGRGAVEGAVTLDGFCGSGALGLEALSQGAVHVTFFDKARTSLDLARSNAQALCGDDVSALFHFALKDMAKFSGRLKEPVSLLFLDPPYGQGLVVRALEGLVQADALVDGAVCVLEMEKSCGDFLPQGFSVFQEKIYGDTKVVFAIYVGSNPE